MVRFVPTVAMTWGTPRSYGRKEVVRLVPTVGMTWGTPRLVRLVPTVGMTWGTPCSYDKNEPRSCGRNDLGHASFLR